MKKIIAVLLITALTAGLFACTPEESGSSSAITPEESAAPEKEEDAGYIVMFSEAGRLMIYTESGNYEEYIYPAFEQSAAAFSESKGLSLSSALISENRRAAALMTVENNESSIYYFSGGKTVKIAETAEVEDGNGSFTFKAAKLMDISPDGERVLYTFGGELLIYTASGTESVVKENVANAGFISDGGVFYTVNEGDAYSPFYKSFIDNGANPPISLEGALLLSASADGKSLVYKKDGEYYISGGVGTNEYKVEKNDRFLENRFMTEQLELTPGKARYFINGKPAAEISFGNTHPVLLRPHDKTNVFERAKADTFGGKLLYLSEPGGGSRLVKLSDSGTEVLLEGEISRPVISDDEKTLYFLRGKKIFTLDLGASEAEPVLLCGSDVSSFAVCGDGCVYFNDISGLFLHDPDGTDKLITKTTVPSVKLSQSNLFGGKVLFYTTANSVLYRTSGEAPEVAAEKPERGVQDRRILGYKKYLIVLDNISSDFPGGSARVTFNGETFSPAGYFM